MFGFLFGNKRPVSPARSSFQPQLEILEGRTLPSGFVPVSQGLAPQNLFQSPAQGQIQVQTIHVEQAPIQIHAVTLEEKPITMLGIAISEQIQRLKLPSETVEKFDSYVQEQLHPFGAEYSVKGPTVSHLTISVDNLKTTPPPSTENTTPPPSTLSIEMYHARERKTSIDPTMITQFLDLFHDKHGKPEQLKDEFQRFPAEAAHNFESLAQDFKQFGKTITQDLKEFGTPEEIKAASNPALDVHGIDSFGL
jgi:hypothetical protein